MFRLHRDALRCLSALIAVALIANAPVTFAAGDAADAAMATIHPEAIRADIRFLSDDLLEGRGTATRGYQIGAKFMATQFEGLGLQPAGDSGTYFQTVPLRSMQIDQTRFHAQPHSRRQGTVAGVRPGLRHARRSRTPETSVEAPVVFVGYGVVARRNSITTTTNPSMPKERSLRFFRARRISNPR